MFESDFWPNVGGVNCTSHKSRPFLRLRRVAKSTVRMIKPTWLWAALGYYKLPLPVYKATLPIVLTSGPYNRFLTRNFNLARFEPNLHHWFRFVDRNKICNMKAVAIGTVEL